ncbi:MAG: sugar phosphate isomerase/epimerase [Desulfobacteraceae bacterium]|nr:sugar phosphate isomerase/epimerase [Desulfobacteraceae bacterium]
MIYGAMNFPVRPILKELEAFSDLGFDYLELTMDAPQAHYSKIRQQKKRLLKALDRHNMKLLCHLPSFVYTADLTRSIRKTSLNEVLRSLEVAAELGCPKAVLHPSYIMGLGIFVMDQAKEYALESLEAVTKKADQLGLLLCIENLFPKIHSLVEPEDFAEIFIKFPTLKLTLDTGHAHIGDIEGKRAVKFIERFPDRIGHIHASDNLGEADNHLPVGAGTVSFSEIVKALKNIGYDDTITLEIFSKDRDYLKISRDKVAAMFATASKDQDQDNGLKKDRTK